MIVKMKDYAAKGKFREALIIGQNLFARDSSDPEVFEAYASVLEAVMAAETTSDGKMRYFQQISSALAAFSEAADMDDSMVRFVISQEDRLGRLFDGIQQFRMQEDRAFVKEKLVANDSILKKLPDVIEEARRAPDKPSFDVVLRQVQQYDEALDKEYLTDRQKASYESMTQQCSKIVDVKLRGFQRAADITYNDQALAAYERAFQYFKTGKVTGDHKDVISGLFGFDAGRLFNETLTYYNHVYAYILSKLDDDGKFRLTKAAIHSEMRR